MKVSVGVWFLVFWLGNSLPAHATHIIGGDISYTCTSGNTYEVTLRLYRDCTGLSLFSTQYLNASSPGCATRAITMQRVGPAEDITPLCGTATSTCGNGGSNGVYGVEEHIYKGTFTVPSGCTDWTLFFEECCRNSVTTLATPSEGIYFYTTLDATLSPCNNSPIFNSRPSAFVCSGDQVSYSQGASDPDGDSLSFSLVDCRQNDTLLVNYVSPYTGSNPLASNGAIQVDPISGNISFMPAASMNGVICIRVEEFRNGVKIGEVIRDIQFNVLNCSNSAPTLSGIDGTQQYTLSVCTGVPIQFSLNAQDANSSDSVFLILNNSIPNSQFSVLPGQVEQATFSWTPTSSDVGSHLFTVEVIDNACPLVGRNLYTYSIQVLPPSSHLTPQFVITPPYCYSSCDGTVAPNVSGGSGSYQYSWSNGSSGSIFYAACAGTDTVWITDGNLCPQPIAYTVPSAPLFSATLRKTDPDCFDAKNGEAIIEPIGGQAPFQYNWTMGGSHLAATDSVGDLSAGWYYVTVTDALYCTHMDSIELVAPPALQVSASGQDLSCADVADGSIQATATGGTGTHSYLWSDGSLSANVNGLAAGAYTVTVTDANGCTATASVTLTAPDTLQVQLFSNDVYCFGESTGSAYANALGGTSPYRYAWSNGDTLSNLYSLPAGQYAITVTDANGCQRVDSTQVNQPTAIVTQSQLTAPRCSDAQDGSIDLTVSGGAGQYTYYWDNNLPFAEDQTGLSAGTYAVTVNDANYCQDTLSFTLQAPTPLILSAQVDSVSCTGAADGAITIAVTGGTAPYQYLWPDGGTASDTTQLAAGTYTVTVTDANGCTTDTTVSVQAPTPLDAVTSIVQHVSCHDAADGSLQAYPTGGTAPYRYLWSDGSVSANVNGLAAGAYTVTVTDANGCTATAPVTLTAPDTLQMQLAALAPTCADLANGEIQTQTQGGTPSYTYLWSNGSSASQPAALLAGTYTVTLTDANSCTVVDSITLVAPAPMSGAISVQSPTCASSTDGAISALVNGGTSPYQYSWSNTAADVSQQTALGAGNYGLIVFDSLGCYWDTTVALIAPAPLQTTAQATDITCADGSDGIVQATVTGGTTPYRYAWNDGSLTANVNGLGVGTYTVTITDANGCQDSATADIFAPPLLEVTTRITQPLYCFGDCDGAIDTKVTGGVPPYQFTWNDPTLTVEDPTQLCAGTYRVTVTDANGCTATSTLALVAPNPLSVQVTTAPTSCAQATDGSASLVIAGGTTGYYWQWSGGITNATQDTVHQLAAGSHTVTVTDGNGCMAVDTFVVGAPAALVMTAVVTDATCDGNADGAIDLTVSGGTGGYSYSWSSGLPSQPDHSNLPKGTYTVTVTDANGCTEIATYTIGAPPALTTAVTVTDASCATAIDGSAQVTATGGTAPYRYLWSDGSLSANVNGLAAGAYTVTVTDANGCTATALTQVTAPDTLQLQLVVDQQVTCFNACDGYLSAWAVGGEQPYQYAWNAGFGNVSGWTSACAGSYTVTVTDANGCTAVASAIVTQPDSLAILVNAVTDVVGCASDSTGAIAVSPVGGTSPYQYQWSPASATTPTIGQLPAGQYALTVTDANGCTAQVDTVVQAPPLISLTVVVTDARCAGASNGAIDLTIAGGVAPYQQVWNGGARGFTEDLAGLPAGTYTVVVTDANGCTDSLSANVGAPLPLVATTNAQPVRCHGATDGSVQVLVSGGAGGYQYAWNGAFGASPSLQQVGAGIYCVQVTDANGCTLLACDTVQSPAPLDVSVAQQQAIGCAGGATGVLSATVTGAQGVVQYVWSNGATQVTASQLSAGSYRLTVTDGQGCTAVDSMLLNAPSPLLNTLTRVQPVTCHQGNTGAIAAAASGGTAPYQYLWSNGQSGPLGSQLSAGIHAVTVTDGNGCQRVDTMTLFAPSALQLSTAVNHVTCKGAATGNATVTVAGGVPGYTFWWSTSVPQSSPTAIQLTAGAYTVYVTDNNGCMDSTEVNVFEPNTAVSVVTQSQPVTCPGGADGGAVAFAAGGVGNYTYQWNTTPPQLAAQATGLSAGSHVVIVTDGNGCTARDTAVVATPQPLAGNPVLTMVRCAGQCNGAVTLQPSGGGGTYALAWNDGSTSPTRTGLCAGTYGYTITDQYGCSAVQSIAITEPLPLQATVQSQIPSCTGEEDGQIAISPQGGTPGVSITWDDGEIGLVRTQLGDGVYAFTMADANGCIVRDTVVLAAFAPVVMGSETTCADIADGTISVSASGGYPPYVTTVDGAFMGSDTLIGGFEPGVYQVTMRDASGCEVTQPVTITAPLAISFGAVPDYEINLGDSIRLNVPTNSNYFYTLWTSSNPDENPSTISCDTCRNTYVRPLVTTTYEFYVETEEGCSSQTFVRVKVRPSHAIYLPTAFTPAPVSLGENDYLFPQSNGREVDIIKAFRVYDRWGNLVYESFDFAPDSPLKGWNGYKDGQLLPADVYIWQVEALFIDGHRGVFSGQTYLSK